ncbi:MULTISPECIES: O-antigen ligase [unclassified Mesorhizobium]|uniref:O-antigen ligase family protein n=1 Tax=unclassified Mesorhizobium TaxID=325217 RepID=UPI000FD83A68|nr:MULTISPECIES: O-antigen ligase [unclassified Mesorhizobium]TGQ40648.1 O-antigen ligase family protein [Mesorhizobium sp. M00.F.Ca.ET.216.01.1.1]TIS60393.1 MAG: O-antigen ligase family protein [Mesorhizobium sp.]TIS91464.1 MAG: O-antigen ligase family protein [Mesorhizobium sp.]TJW14012.1 MAG: O-antigen ligase family protein [Mesorhizobium sp.]TJW41848.1 MAG: O-antigen ligase family protein [Mesorhizobium sp.]
MKIPKSLLVEPDKSHIYGCFAVIVSVFAFAYSTNFGKILILAYYAVWLPLIFVDYRRFLRHLSSAWLPLTFAAYICFSVFWSHAPGITARAGVQYFSHILCAYVAARTVSVRTLVVGSLIGVFVVLLYSLRVGSYALDTIDGTTNFVGAFGSKNQVGFFSSLGIYLCFVFVVFYRRGWPSLVWTAPIGLLSVYMLVICHSATSVASLPAALAVVILLAMSKVLSRRYRRVLFAVGTCAVVASVMAALNLGLLDFVLGIFGKDSTLTGRTYLWEQGWEAAQQFPILGYGYAAYWVQGFAEAERLWAEFFITTRTGFHFHNTYIETLVELGFIGVALISIVILRAFYGHVSAVIFRDWQADSVVLAGAVGLMLLRSFFEVEILGPYFMASFVVYYSLFKLRGLAVARTQRARIAIQEAKAANG